MPIRINLLAEQQSAEEARRRDPVKRVLIAGAGLVLLMVLWIGSNFAKIKTLESEFQAQTNRLAEVEGASKEVRANHAEIMHTRAKITALERYAQNRFFWGSFLDSLQHLTVNELRLTEVRGEHVYRENEGNKLFATNLTVTVTEKPPFWKFWATAHAAETPTAALERMLGGITNRAVFQTNKVEYKLKTNFTPGPKGTLAKLEFTTLPYATEQIKVELRGRDYAKRHGTGIDEFTERLTNAEFFKEWLSPTEGYRFTERPPLARPDPTDPENPGALFVPFTIECRIKERVFTHE